MKKVLYLIALLIISGMISCEKLGIHDTPGNISGMGSNNGRLEIKEPYSLPDGIFLPEPIIEKAPDGILPRYGSGSVHLKITLLNYSDTDKTVFFPKGLLFECNSTDNHNLMLLQTCWVCIKPNRSKSFILDIYCINLARKHPADPGITYKIAGISGSKVMNNLIEQVGWRKTNYEMIIGSSRGIMNQYNDLVSPISDIVWDLTDRGSDISDEDRQFLNSIQELTYDEIPKKDNKGNYPSYFDEYVIREKR